MRIAGAALEAALDSQSTRQSSAEQPPMRERGDSSDSRDSPKGHSARHREAPPCCRYIPRSIHSPTFTRPHSLACTHSRARPRPKRPLLPCRAPCSSSLVRRPPGGLPAIVSHPHTLTNNTPRSTQAQEHARRHSCSHASLSRVYLAVASPPRCPSFSSPSPSFLSFFSLSHSLDERQAIRFTCTCCRSAWGCYRIWQKDPRWLRPGWRPERQRGKWNKRHAWRSELKRI